MNETPETDEAVKASNGQWSFVLKETCQRLERERNKAVEDATNYYAKIGELERERDEAMEALSGRTVSCAACNHAAIERDEAREKAERYRLEANAMMLQRDEAQKHLQDIKEYGTEEINAAVELRQKLAAALHERDEAREKIKRQSERIRELEGATNHDGGIKKIESLKYHGTDETDAMVELWESRHLPADFARRMEAERNEARRLADTRLDQLEAITNSEPKDYLGLVYACKNHRKHIAQLIKEHDKAQEDATNYYARIGELESERDELKKIVEQRILVGAEIHNKANSLIKQNDKTEAECERLRRQLTAATSALRQIHLEVGDWIRSTVIVKE